MRSLSPLKAKKNKIRVLYNIESVKKGKFQKFQKLKKKEKIEKSLKDTKTDIKAFEPKWVTNGFLPQNLAKMRLEDFSSKNPFRSFKEGRGNSENGKSNFAKNKKKILENEEILTKNKEEINKIEKTNKNDEVLIKNRVEKNDDILTKNRVEKDNKISKISNINKIDIKSPLFKNKKNPISESPSELLDNETIRHLTFLTLKTGKKSEKRRIVRKETPVPEGGLANFRKELRKKLEEEEEEEEEESCFDDFDESESFLEIC